MLVSQILKTKSDDGVVTVAPGTTVAKAAEVLSSRKIGAVSYTHLDVYKRQDWPASAP